MFYHQNIKHNKQPIDSRLSRLNNLPIFYNDNMIQVIDSFANARESLDTIVSNFS